MVVVERDSPVATPAGTSERTMASGSPDAVGRDRELVQAYSFLQLTIGLLAIALPFVVLGIDWLSGDVEAPEVRGSISAYYYSRGGGWFVGTLCVTAFFFLSYKFRWEPHGKTDFFATRIASAAALGVALFPTPSPGSETNVVGVIHYLSAVVLFGLLAFLVLHSFTKTVNYRDGGLWVELKRLVVERRDLVMLPGKVRRNRLYRLSGWSMVALLVFSLLYSRVESGNRGAPANILPDSWFFFVESAVIIVFGFIWLLKSQRFPLLPKDNVIIHPAVHSVDAEIGRDVNPVAQTTD